MGNGGSGGRGSRSSDIPLIQTQCVIDAYVANMDMAYGPGAGYVQYNSGATANVY